MRDEVLKEHQRKVDRIYSEVVDLHIKRDAIDDLILTLATSLGYEIGFFHGFHGLDHDNQNAKRAGALREEVESL